MATQNTKTENEEKSLSECSESENENLENLNDEDEELSVGSPENPEENPNSTTAALRILRKRRNSAASENEELKPLDFTNKKDSENSGQSYFLPYKKLEMTQAEYEAKEKSEKRSNKKGVAGFSIDDILSHKTAALKEKSEQSIVRPWDIANSSAQALAAAQAQLNQVGANGGNESRQSRKQKGNQGDSSPLDALFQMASKTFEGLKAKSGKKK